MHLADGRLNPRGTATALLAAHPRWITENAGWTSGLVGHYCSDHDLMSLAANAFELSAQASEGTLKTRALVAAATAVQVPTSNAPSLLLHLRTQAAASPSYELSRARSCSAPTTRRAAGLSTLSLKRAGRRSRQARRPNESSPETLGRTNSSTKPSSTPNAHSNSTQRAAKPRSSRPTTTWPGGACSPPRLPTSREVDLLKQALAQRKAWAGPVTRIRRDLDPRAAHLLAAGGECDDPRCADKARPRAPRARRDRQLTAA